MELNGKERFIKKFWLILLMDVLIEGALGVRDFSREAQRELFTFDYMKVHPRYHAAETPDTEVVLYKGGKAGLEQIGFLSNAVQYARRDHLFEIKRIIESGDEEAIRRVFNRHTSYYGYTPLLSTTLNPQMAQVFASTHPFRKHDNTIYELRVKAERCVVDIYDTGACGESKEVLVLGAIFPDEIRAVKIVNDDQHSELLGINGDISLLHFKPDKHSRNTSIRDPQNWLRLDVRKIRPKQHVTGPRAQLKVVNA